MRSITPISLIIVALCILTMASVAFACPPSPDAIEKFKAEGVWEEKLENLRLYHQRQLQELAQTREANRVGRQRLDALADGEVDTSYVMVILVDFPDYTFDSTHYDAPVGNADIYSSVAGSRDMFDSLLFSRRDVDAVFNPTGSLTEFYQENTLGSKLILGNVYGWYTMPEDYSWYVGGDDGISRGSILAHSACSTAYASGADFRDHTIDGYNVPGVIIVHAGPGAETGAYGVWSHKSTFSPSQIGIYYINGYSMNPEEQGATLSNMGVFAHEWGHVLGAVDLYDVDYSPAGSNGIGKYSVMAGGSWNNGGQSPSHFDAFHKIDLNFTDFISVSANVRQQPIPQVETDGVIYFLPDNLSGGSNEYWLVENRQRVGLFDPFLPGDGLLIYHVDNLAPKPQTDPNRYYVAVEQADGLNSLAFGGSSGDAGDYWPGSTDNRDFFTYSVPNSRLNVGDSISQVGVWDISDSDSLMYADFDVVYSRPWLVLADDSLTLEDPAPDGNANGIWEQGETIELQMEVQNVMAGGFVPYAFLSCDAPEIEILTDSVGMGVSLNPAFRQTFASPIQFRIPDDFSTRTVNFTVTVKSKVSFGDLERANVNIITFDAMIGTTQILLVDDDNGRTDETRFITALDELDLTYDVWNKYSQGSPTFTDLSKYKAVFWMTGRSNSGSALVAADVTAMQAFLDNSGSLCLTSLTATQQLQSLNPTFMSNYLHATPGSGAYTSYYYLGVDGNPVGDQRFHRSLITSDSVSLILPGSGADAAFILTDVSQAENYGTCGVTYDGAYNTAFLTFSIEYLSTTTGGTTEPPAVLISRILSFFDVGPALAVDEDEAPSVLPQGFRLAQNYPNPFNPSTTISYTIGAGDPTRTTLSIFNMLGQKVVTLVDKVQNAGDYEVTWDGKSTAGGQVPTGIYLYRLTRDNVSETKKMILLK